MHRSTIDAQDKFRAFPQADAEQAMRQVGLRLLESGNSIFFRRRAESEPAQLWKYEPHPVGPLGPRGQLLRHLLVDARLGIDKAL